jgi:hypothetical protein
VNQALRAAGIELHTAVVAKWSADRDRAVALLNQCEQAVAAVVVDLQVLNEVDRHLLAPNIATNIIIEPDPDADRTQNLAAGLALRDVIERAGEDLLFQQPRLRSDHARKWLADQPMALDPIVVDALNAALRPDERPEEPEGGDQ